MHIAPTSAAAVLDPAPMPITTPEKEPYAGWAIYQLDEVRDDLNAALSELVHVKEGIMPTPDVMERQLKLVTKARTQIEGVLGHDATADALQAAHAVLPHMTRATELLHALRQPSTPADYMPLVDNLGAAMDQIEALLGAVGFD